MPFRKGNKLGVLNKGKTRSDEWKAARSKKYTGKGNSFYGKHHTQETRDRLSRIRLNTPAWKWKGDNAGYTALHTWVKRRLKKPELCVECHERPALDLANISQEYRRDLTDWEWLCRHCHMTKDGRIRHNLKQYVAR